MSTTTGQDESKEISRRLYVTRFGEFVRKKDLLKAFRLYGCTHAVVQRKRTGNTAFVTFPIQDHARRALEEVRKHPITLKGRQIRVLPADAWHDRALIRQNSTPADSREQGPALPPLPVEILARVSSYLPFADRARMEQVCRTWRTGVWASMRDVRELTSDDWRCPADWDMVRISSTGLHWATIRGQNLTSVRLPKGANFTPVPTQNIAIAAKRSPRLEVVDITGITIRPTALWQMVNLTTLVDLKNWAV